MKSRLIYLGHNTDAYTALQESIKNVICYATSKPIEAKKFIESRYPDVVVVSSDLIGLWKDDDISHIMNLPIGVKLIIEFEDISNATLINLVNTFNVDKFIKVGERENASIILDSIPSSEGKKNSSQIINELEKKIAHYEYVMSQYLIEE